MRYSFKILKVFKVRLFGGIENFIKKDDNSVEIKVTVDVIEEFFDCFLKNLLFQLFVFVLFLFVFTGE